jgi:hypothetical protein
MHTTIAHTRPRRGISMIIKISSSNSDKHKDFTTFAYLTTRLTSVTPAPTGYPETEIINDLHES